MDIVKQIHTIFYSWQSDLPSFTNSNAIRKALRNASSEVEGAIEGIIIKVDEATRDKIGSPDILNTIFKKIAACDIFICDLTTINNKTAGEGRKVPNPNVLIELGFAIATLGWERIIILFNTNFGTFPNDLPFDLDRHRAAKFNIKEKKDNNEINRLANILNEAIEAIIEESPLKPSEIINETPAQIKRKKDLHNLKLALNQIHILSFDHFIEEMPRKIYLEIYYFYECFCAIMNSYTFHIYDPELSKRLLKFKEDWVGSLSYGQFYDSVANSSKSVIFYLPMDLFPSDQAEDAFRELQRIRLELDKSFKDLLFYVRANYIEIDLEETSKMAIDSYWNDDK